MCKIKVNQPENLIKYVMEEKGTLTTWDGYPVEVTGLSTTFKFKDGQKKTLLLVRFKDTKGVWHDATCDSKGIWKKETAFFVPDISSQLREKVAAERAKGFLNVYLKPSGGLDYYWYPNQEDADKAARNAKSQRLACIAYKGFNVLDQ